MDQILFQFCQLVVILHQVTVKRRVCFGSSVSNTATPPSAIPADCAGTLYSASTGQACPADTVTNITIPTVAPLPTVSPAETATNIPIDTSVFKFTKNFEIRFNRRRSVAIAKELKTLGYYAGKLDGGFGSMTEKAVKAFQKAHKLSQVGSVGPQTRALLKQIR